MRDAKLAILEDQVDTLAGRVGDAEERLRLLVRLLTSGTVASRLGLEAKDIADRCEVLPTQGDRWKSSNERHSRLAKAELDDFRRRVATAESLANLTGQSFIEAWDAAQDDDDDSDTDRDRTPAASRPDPTVWDKALAHLATVVNRYSFVTWFEETSLVRDDGAMLVVRAGDAMAAAWLEKRYADEVSAALAAVGRPGTSVKFVEDDGEEDVN